MCTPLVGGADGQDPSDAPREGCGGRGAPEKGVGRGGPPGSVRSHELAAPHLEWGPPPQPLGSGQGVVQAVPPASGRPRPRPGRQSRGGSSGLLHASPAWGKATGLRNARSCPRGRRACGGRSPWARHHRAHPAQLRNPIRHAPPQAQAHVSLWQQRRLGQPRCGQL